MKVINDKRTGLLYATKPEANLKKQDLSLAFFLTWKQEYPVAYKKFGGLEKDDVILYLIDEYLTAQLKKADTLTSADKSIFKIFAAFDVLNVLMDEKSVEDKHAELAKWETTMLEIVGNDFAEVLKIGRTVGDTKVRINENPKIKAYKEREAILKKGRAKGAQVQKDYAAETKNLIETMNADLLKHPNTARWKLRERAEYIEKKLIEMNRKQINGRPYKAGAIKLSITGKG